MLHSALSIVAKLSTVINIDSNVELEKSITLYNIYIYISTYNIIEEKGSYI